MPLPPSIGRVTDVVKGPDPGGFYVVGNGPSPLLSVERGGRVTQIKLSSGIAARLSWEKGKLFVADPKAGTLRQVPLEMNDTVTIAVWKRVIPGTGASITPG